MSTISKIIKMTFKSVIHRATMVITDSTVSLNPLQVIEME